MRAVSIPPPNATSRLSVGGTLPLAATALTGLLLGAALVAKPSLVIALIALSLAAIGIAVAFTHPSAAFVGLIAITAFIPSYAAPSIGPMLFIPAAAASWALAVALGWRNLVEKGRIFKPTLIDAGVGLFVLLMAISIAFSPRASHDEFIHLMFPWLGPYLGARLLLADVEHPMKVVAASFGLATAITAPFALFEYLGASNVFHALNFNSAEFATWAGQAERSGVVRAEAAFGHPIALSMFAATSAVLTLAMALRATETRERRLWYASTALAVAVQVFTVSRTGWLMLVIGGAAIIIITARGANRGRLAGFVAGLGLILFVLSVAAPSALQSLPGFGKSEAATTQSSHYRQALITRALEPGVLNPWGNAQNRVTPFVNFSSATDNAYILLADAWGLIPTAALFFVGLSLLFLVIRWQSSDPEFLVALPIVGFASMVSLFFVAFITQQQVIIWMLIGAGSVAAERLLTSQREATPRKSDARPLVSAEQDVRNVLLNGKPIAPETVPLP